MLRFPRFNLLLIFIAVISLCSVCMAKMEKKAKDGFDCATACTGEFYVATYARLATSAIGSGNVDIFLLRAKMIKCNMYYSNKALNDGRKILSGIAATTEQKEQFEAKEKEIEEAKKEKDKEVIRVELNKMQDEAIQKASEDGSFEKAQLDDKQKKQVAKLSFNMTLAGVYEALTAKDIVLMVKEGKEIVDKIKSDKKQALKMARQVKEITGFITNDAPAISKAIPEHGKAFATFVGAVKVIRENNEIEDLGEPKKGDTFKEIEF